MMSDDLRPSRRDLSAGQLGFGKILADKVSVCRYDPSSGWGAPKVVPYRSLEIDPCALVLHYGQAIYEGMKAYAQRDGSVALFRPERNAARFRASARRMAMAEMPEELFVRAAAELVTSLREWVPSEPGTSLYLRPVMIGDEAAFGIRRSASYLFFIVATPVDNLYREGDRPLGLQAIEDYARAAPGGGGDAKTAGNYGRTIVALEAARRAGFDNVLWLDPIHRKNIEEAGITNIFIRQGDAVMTPPLNGRILAGVNRESAIDIHREWSIPVEERELSIFEILNGIDSGRVSEVFVTGTAMHVAPVGRISFRGLDHTIDCSSLSDSITLRISTVISSIQQGISSDLYGWMRKLD
jgi:branched-chain amino acid aminotransferase